MCLCSREVSKKRPGSALSPPRRCIFTRSAHGIVLTEQGEIFYRETRELVRAYKAAAESGRSANRDHRTVRSETDSSGGNRTEPMKRLPHAEYEQLFSDFGSQSAEPYAPLFPSAADFRLPQRKPVSHKYSYGRALIIAGSVGFSGAPGCWLPTPASAAVPV